MKLSREGDAEEVEGKQVLSQPRWTFKPFYDVKCCVVVETTLGLVQVSSLSDYSFISGGFAQFFFPLSL